MEFFPSFWLVELYCYSKFGEYPGSLVVRTRTFTAGALVQSLVGELRSRKPCSKAKKKKKQEKKNNLKYVQIITQKTNFLQVLVKEKNVLDVNHSQACVLPPPPPLTSPPGLHPSVPSLLVLNLPLSPVGGPRLWCTPSRPPTLGTSLHLSEHQFSRVW